MYVTGVTSKSILLSEIADRGFTLYLIGWVCHHTEDRVANDLVEFYVLCVCEAEQ